MSSLSVKVHPIVLFTILDSFERRSKSKIRVIGTLLGTRDKSGNVEVSNSFVVNHKEEDNEVAIDIEVAKELFELHKKVNSAETIVGWFSVGGGEVNEYSVLIHEYYSRETNNPVHMTVDPNRNGISIKAYISAPFGVPTKNIGTMFSPITCIQTVAGYETEMVGLKACMGASGISDGKQVSYDSEIEMILAAAAKSTDIIGTLIKYIDDNILNNSGKPAPSNSNDIGRQLMAMVESIAHLSHNDQDALNTNLKDLLMVIYLSNLSKTQLLLNEKLSLI